MDRDAPRSAQISRRKALALGGGGMAGGMLAVAGCGGGGTTSAASSPAPSSAVRKQSGKLPVDDIQKVIGVEGDVSDGVLSIDLSRDDIGDVEGPDGITFTGDFEVDGMLTFQPLGHEAFFNGCLALKTSETNDFIDAIIANDLIVQALHQHFDEAKPNFWFVHWRGVGEPVEVARSVRKVLDSTAIELPQKTPSKPTSPLDDKRLAQILKGDAQIGGSGVVTVIVPRKDTITIDGVQVSPDANISSNISFSPLKGGGAASAAAAPDFSMTAAEVMPVLKVMRSLKWDIGCLYNQETDENPQLYFSHMAKRGDAYELAAEIRRGLDHTAT